MITAKVDPESLRRTRRQIDDYAKRKGVAVDHLIDELAGLAARQLASRVQPFGLSVAKMKKFQRSIGAQVNRAIRNANITPGGEGAKAAHEARRNSKGQVTKGLPTGGQFKRWPISIDDRKALAEEKKKGAGALKGAWLDAGHQSHPQLKFPKFFNSVLANGSAVKRGRGMNHEVILNNRLDHAPKQMSATDIRVALQRAYRGFFNKMRKTLEKP